MAGFFSKASSFLNSQAQHGNPAPAPSHADDEKPSKPASSGGYGDLLAGAEALMQKPAKSKVEENPTDVADDTPHTQPSSGSGGYGDLLASAQKMMGSAKVSDGDQGTVAHGGQNVTKSGDEAGYGDVMASAQVLMGAAKKSREGAGAPDNMGEVAGAAANLVDAGSRYGNLEKTAYGEYAEKAETYLRNYETSHGGKNVPGKPAEGSDDHTVLPAAGDHGTGRRTATAVDEEGKADQEAAVPPSAAHEDTQLKSNEGFEQEYTNCPAPRT